jgi:LysR family glycine cleavage system transcriptional activator
MVTQSLLRDIVTPLCSPDFLARRTRQPDDPATILDSELIHIDWGASFASYPTWAEWFSAAGAARMPQVELGHTTSMSSLAIDLAVSGCGIALGQRLLARDELADGRLVAPFAQTLALGHDYCVVFPHSRRSKRAVKAFIDWVGRNV